MRGESFSNALPHLVGKGLPAVVEPRSLSVARRELATEPLSPSNGKPQRSVDGLGSAKVVVEHVKRGLEPFAVLFDRRLGPAQL